MIQELAVAAIVVLAAVYVGAKYLPAAWRKRIVFALSRGEGESKLSRWLDTGASCGTGCASCKACEPGTDAAAGENQGDAGRRADGSQVIKLHRKKG